MFSGAFFDIYNATLSIVKVSDVYGQTTIVILANLAIAGHWKFSK